MNQHLKDVMKKILKVLPYGAISIGAVTGITLAEVIPGQHYFGKNNYIEYIAGSMPIILSAPHGGNLIPSSIPSRTIGDTIVDKNTIGLTLAMADALYSLYGKYPHVILCHLKRSKLDANRDRDTGAQNSQEAQIAWDEFHAFIMQAKQKVVADFNQGCYFDIHGHAHVLQRIEVGYLLGPTSLSLSDASLPSRKNFTSVKVLANTTTESFASLIRGSYSLGGLLQSAGYACVPSPLYPGPDTNPYFGGGYDIERHGSRDSGTISGIQMECNLSGLRDSQQNWISFGAVFAKAMETYFKTHFKMVLAPTTKLSYSSEKFIPEIKNENGVGRLLFDAMGRNQNAKNTKAVAKKLVGSKTLVNIKQVK